MASRRTCDDFVHTTLSLFGVPEDDLKQFAAQCHEVGLAYVPRQRQTVYGFLGGLAAVAHQQVVERARGDEPGYGGVTYSMTRLHR